MLKIRSNLILDITNYPLYFSQLVYPKLKALKTISGYIVVEHPNTGLLAQMVERRADNAKVLGSIPRWTIYRSDLFLMIQSVHSTGVVCNPSKVARRVRVPLDAFSIFAQI